jgi:hypothetical protein
VKDVTDAQAEKAFSQDGRVIAMKPLAQKVSLGIGDLGRLTVVGQAFVERRAG